MTAAASTIVFAHGNSFPGGTYRRMLDALRQRGFTVHAIDRLGHDPAYPVTDNWPHLTQQLADFSRSVQSDASGPVYLVGHSLGGMLSIMAAAQHPGLAKGVVLLDSPLVSGWRATTVGVAKRAQVVGRVSPGRISMRRRVQWSSREEALAHFVQKKRFAAWDPLVLEDYIAHGTECDAEGHCRLRFDREVETRIYNTIPHHFSTLLRRHPLRCPAAFIGGRHSSEMRQVGLALTQRVTQGRITMLDGSHLFPMEQPLTTAAAVEAALHNLDYVQRQQR